MRPKPCYEALVDQFNELNASDQSLFFHTLKRFGNWSSEDVYEFIASFYSDQFDEFLNEITSNLAMGYEADDDNFLGSTDFRRSIAFQHRCLLKRYWTLRRTHAGLLRLMESLTSKDSPSEAALRFYRSRGPYQKTAGRDARIVELKEKEGMSFVQIAKQLQKENPAWAGKNGKPLKAGVLRTAYFRAVTKTTSLREPRKQSPK